MEFGAVLGDTEALEREMGGRRIDTVDYFQQRTYDRYIVPDTSLGSLRQIARREVIYPVQARNDIVVGRKRNQLDRAWLVKVHRGRAQLLAPPILTIISPNRPCEKLSGSRLCG